jgi:2-aminoadipate transaminase
MISFTRGVPCLEALDSQKIEECAEAVLEADGSTILQYGTSAGYMPLSELLAEWYEVTPNEIIVSNGSLQILDFISTLLLSPGDTVFIEEPTYDRTITLFRRHQVNLVGIPMESDGLNTEFLTEQLERVVPKLAYIIPDFQNPTGITTSASKRETLVALAERYGFWVVEDSPYRALRYEGSELPTLFSINPKRVLHLSSFSKVLSPGIRVGYLVAPSDLVKGVAKVAEDTYVTPSLLSQGIAWEFCRRGWLEPNIERLKVLYGPRLKALTDSLHQHLTDALWVKPEGGFFVGVTLPEGIDMEAFRQESKRAGLVLTRGENFFPQGGGERFLRLPFPALDPQEIEEGISRLGKAAERTSSLGA